MGEQKQRPNNRESGRTEKNEQCRSIAVVVVIVVHPWQKGGQGKQNRHAAA